MFLGKVLYPYLLKCQNTSTFQVKPGVIPKSTTVQKLSLLKSVVLVFLSHEFLRLPIAYRLGSTVYPHSIHLFPNPNCVLFFSSCLAFFAAAPFLVPAIFCAQNFSSEFSIRIGRVGHA